MANLFSKDDLRPVQIGLSVFDFKEIVVNLDYLSGLFNQKYLLGRMKISSPLNLIFALNQH